MVCVKLNPSSFLIFTTLILVILSSSSSTGSVNGIEDGVVSVVIKRLEGSGDNGNLTTPLVLAEERTRRKDPRDDLKYYTGGWDIKNEHYIFSVLYTGFPAFLVAGLWLVGYGIFMLLACMCFCCCRRRRYGYSKFAYALSLVLLCLFTIAAVIGSAVLYTGQGKFNGSTKSTLNYVLEQANTTADGLKGLSNTLMAAQQVRVDQISLPQDVQNKIRNVSTLISSAADNLGSVTNDNKDKIYKVLDAVGMFLIIVAAVMLMMALLGFLLSILGLQCLVYILVVVCWILVALTFILCGIFLVLHNVMGDTCVAMNEWANNPTAQTALDDIIPCVDPITAGKALSQSKEVTFQMVRLVNGIVTNISNANNVPPSAGPPLYYNQSGPLVPVLCNPYNSDNTDRLCVTGEVDLNNATQVWKNYECQVSGSNICMSVGRLTPDLYNQLSSVVDVSYGLNYYGPFLTDLIGCKFVRDTFITIHDKHCPDLRQDTKLVYIGLAMVSFAVMLSLILWVLYARERRHRKYTKLVDATSGVAASPYVNSKASY